MNKSNSVYKNKGGKKADAVADLIALLTQEQNKAFKHDTLQELKGAKGRELLIEAIESTDEVQIKRILFAACWESGNDFSAYLPFFVSHLPGADLETAIDIFTVIEDMQGPFETKLITECVNLLSEHTSSINQPVNQIINNTIQQLKGRI